MSMPTKDVTTGVVSTIGNDDLVMVAGAGGWSPIKFTDLMAAIRGGIQIGGRNLLKGTADWSGFANQGGTHVVGPDSYRGCKVVHIDSAKAYQGMNQIISIEAGDNTILSFYCKASSTGVVRLRTLNGSSEKAYIINITAVDTWERFSILITEGMTQLRMEIGEISNSASGVCFCAPKLERGNMPTDWSPAPEDIASGN